MHSGSSTTSSSSTKSSKEEFKKKMQKWLDEGLNREEAFARALREIRSGQNSSDHQLGNGKPKTNEPPAERMEEVDGTGNSSSTVSTTRFGYSSTSTTSGHSAPSSTGNHNMDSMSNISGAMDIVDQRHDSIVIHEDGEDVNALASHLNKKTKDKKPSAQEENIKQEDDDMVEINTNDKKKEEIQELALMDEDVQGLNAETEENKKKEEEELEKVKKEEIAHTQQLIEVVVNEYQDQLKNMKRECLEPDQRIMLYRQAFRDDVSSPTSSSSCLMSVRENYDELLEKVTIGQIEELLNLQDKIFLTESNKEIEQTMKKETLTPLFDEFYSLFDNILRCFESPDILAQSFVDKDMWQYYEHLELEKRKDKEEVDSSNDNMAIESTQKDKTDIDLVGSNTSIETVVDVEEEVLSEIHYANNSTLWINTEELTGFFDRLNDILKSEDKFIRIENEYYVKVDSASESDLVIESANDDMQEEDAPTATSESASMMQVTKKTEKAKDESFLGVSVMKSITEGINALQNDVDERVKTQKDINSNIASKKRENDKEITTIIAESKHLKESYTIPQSEQFEKDVKTFYEGWKMRSILFFLSYFQRELSNFVLSEEPLRKLLHTICALPEESKKIFIDWLASPRCSSETFGNYLQTIHNYITYTIATGKPSDSERRAHVGARAMASFYKANSQTESRDSSSYGRAKIDYREFYNETINDYFTIGLDDDDGDQEERTEDLLRREIGHWENDRRSFTIAKKDKKPFDINTTRSFISFPFLLKASLKATILKIIAKLEMSKNQHREIQNAMALGLRSIRPYLVLNVGRDNIVRDTLHELAIYEQHVKKPLKVIFKGEEGVDEGGVQKEFFLVLLKQLMDKSYGMFVHEEESRCLWFNCDSEESEEFQLIGTIMGLAIYNSVILEIAFPPFVYKKLKNPNLALTLDDLRWLRPTVGDSMATLLSMAAEEVENLCLTFQVSYTSYVGEVKFVDLKENGSEIDVTAENRQEYVDLYVDWVLNKSVEMQFKSFRNGFNKLCSKQNIQMFHPSELELLVCGNPVFDFEAFVASVNYENGYTKDSTAIGYFWEVVREYSELQKRLLLKFITSSDRIPIEGMAKLGVVILKNGDDCDRLPTAQTCYNYLLLPNYSSKEKLQKLLTIAVENAEGFGLR